MNGKRYTVQDMMKDIDAALKQAAPSPAVNASRSQLFQTLKNKVAGQTKPQPAPENMMMQDGQQL